jgi:DNA-binding NarL/FixJ family response regulator
MTALENQPSPKRRLLLASDRIDRSSELAGILQSVGEVDTISTSDIPEAPADHFAGIVVDINLRSPESVQLIRNKLRAEAYRSMPRLFVLSDALHHGSMQAWALGATDTISRPFDAQGILQRIRSAFPDTVRFDATASGKALNRGIAAAHEVMVKIFEKLPAGIPLTISDVMEAENQILKAIKQSSLREWLTTVGRHRVRAASRYARGRPAPADARLPAARCWQGLHSSGCPRQAGETHGPGNQRDAPASASGL